MFSWLVAGGLFFMLLSLGSMWLMHIDSEKRTDDRGNPRHLDLACAAMLTLILSVSLSCFMGAWQYAVGYTLGLGAPEIMENANFFFRIGFICSAPGFILSVAFAFGRYLRDRAGRLEKFWLEGSGFLCLALMFFIFAWFCFHEGDAANRADLEPTSGQATAEGIFEAQPAFCPLGKGGCVAGR